MDMAIGAHEQLIRAHERVRLMDCILHGLYLV